MNSQKVCIARVLTRTGTRLSLSAFLAIALFSARTLSAETLPWRISAFVGIPSGIGLEAEYAPPVRVGIVRPAIEVHAGTYPPLTFTGSVTDVTLERSLGLGASAIAYFRDSRDGPFVAVGYDYTWYRLNADIDDSDSINPVPYSVLGDFSYQSVEARLGWRWIVRRLTILAEGGYGIAFFDGTIPATVSSDGKEAEKKTTLYWNESSSRASGWVARLGLGVAL